MVELKILMIRKGVTQIQMAHDLRIHPSSLNLIVKGWRAPSPALKEKIAAYLGVSEVSVWGLEATTSNSERGNDHD